MIRPQGTQPLTIKTRLWDNIRGKYDRAPEMPGTMLAGGLCRSGRDTPCGDCHDLIPAGSRQKGPSTPLPVRFVFHAHWDTRHKIHRRPLALCLASINIPASHVFHPRWHIRLKKKFIGHHLPAPASPLIPVADLLVLRLPSYWSENSYADSDTLRIF